MIQLQRESGRYKFYTIDCRSVLSRDRREELIAQLDILLTEQSQEMMLFQLVSIIPFQDEYVVILKA